MSEQSKCTKGTACARFHIHAGSDHWVTRPQQDVLLFPGFPLSAREPFRSR